MKFSKVLWLPGSNISWTPYDADPLRMFPPYRNPPGVTAYQCRQLICSLSVFLTTEYLLPGNQKYRNNNACIMHGCVNCIAFPGQASLCSFQIRVFNECLIIKIYSTVLYNALQCCLHSHAKTSTCSPNYLKWHPQDCL